MTTRIVIENKGPDDITVIRQDKNILTPAGDGVISGWAPETLKPGEEKEFYVWKETSLVIEEG